ncbi:MAG: 5-(carboxyamino)imidazole ribonucleotide mutase [Candidatus Aenigmarchaeota archaeon ex4484_52]|nr:MAG: 5-(carboxyamino)imidazole ribonucleotide mutase [Candidatus Aenigmarchaeota archaeon ex4484_52]
MKNTIAIISSVKDSEFVKEIEIALKKYNAKYGINIASAHKTPNLLEIINKYDNEFDNVVYINVAGLSNRISRVVASNTKNPTIACHNLNEQNYLIDIYSTLRMPSNTYSMCVLNPKNTALAALKILGFIDKKLKEKL